MSARFVFVLEYRDVDMTSSVHGIYSTRDFAVAVALELAEEAIRDAYLGEDVRVDREDGSNSVVIRLLDGGGGEMCERWTIERAMLDADVTAPEPARPPQDQYLADVGALLRETVYRAERELSLPTLVLIVEAVCVLFLVFGTANPICR